MRSKRPDATIQTSLNARGGAQMKGRRMRESTSRASLGDGLVPASEYYAAQPDPLADSAVCIIQHINADHGDVLVLLAKAFSGIEALQ